MVSHSMAYVYRPSTIEGIGWVFQLARDHGRTVISRGSGYSYGDASLNAENIVLDTTRLNRILKWDPQKGEITVEPGVTVRQLYRHILEDGWWPSVVPGAMYPTVGGCVSTNVHGKNHWQDGIFGDYVASLDLLLPSGKLISCSRHENEDIFRAVIGGLGLLGSVVSISLRAKPVTSGLLQVTEIAVGSLDEMVQLFQENGCLAHYLVGWVDAFAEGACLGRGLVQIARNVEYDAMSDQTLRADFQDLPDTVFGLVPRSKLWLAMKPTVNDVGMSVLNRARFALGRFKSGTAKYIPHAQFQFFHDFVPDWKRSFLPGGIVQYQAFVPATATPEVFSTLLRECRNRGFLPYLAVFKQHRVDDFLLSYGVEGYSLSLDFRPHAGELPRLHAFLRNMTRRVVLPANGRFYPAKDNVLDAESSRLSFGDREVERFLAIKQRLDPESTMQSDLFRRMLAKRPEPVAGSC